MDASGVDKENSVFRRPALKLRANRAGISLCGSVECNGSGSRATQSDTPKRTPLRVLTNLSGGTLSQNVLPCRPPSVSSPCLASAIVARRFMPTPPTCHREQTGTTPHLTPVRGTPGRTGAAPTHNPFENEEAMVSLSLPTASPSLFKHVVSPSDRETPGWDIEHVSLLNPVQIEVTPYQKQLMCQKYDSPTEQQVQSAIDKFFSSGRIVPSPWSCSTDVSCAPTLQKRCLSAAAALGVSSTSCQYDSPLRRVAMSTSCRPNNSSNTNKRSALAAVLASPVVSRCVRTMPPPPAPVCCEVATQTTLSLPPQLPDHILHLLEQYSHGGSEGGGPAARDADESLLSTSTLRRKLMFDVGSCVRAGGSGDQEGEEDSDSDDPMLEDVSMVGAENFTPEPTPGLGQLESSPHTDRIELHRTTPGRPMVSPPVSPILVSHFTPSNATTSHTTPSPESLSLMTSQGLGKIRYSSSEMSDQTDSECDRSSQAASADLAEYLLLNASQEELPGDCLRDTGYRSDQVTGASMSSTTQILAEHRASAVEDAGYQSTLGSLSSFSHFMAGTSMSGRHGDGQRRVLHSTRLDPQPALSVLWRYDPDCEASMDQHAPVPIGSSTPGRSGSR